MKFAFQNDIKSISFRRLKNTFNFMKNTVFPFSSHVKKIDKLTIKPPEVDNTIIKRSIQNDSLILNKIESNMISTSSEKNEGDLSRNDSRILIEKEAFNENFLSFSYKNNINYKYDLQDKASNFFHSSHVKLIHYLDDKNINNFKKGIVENDYEIYEIYKEVPEFLFLGRSNVGKSSLINSIFNRELTNPHKTPGKTQKIEFYLMGTPKKRGTRGTIYPKYLNLDQKNIERNMNTKGIFLDAPGFGYVTGPVELRRKFKYLIYTYLNYAVRLKQIIYLINGEYGMTDMDKEELEFINKFNKEIQLVFTKVDKKNKNNLIQFVSEASHFSRHLKNVRNEILLTSTRTKYGIHNLRTHLYLDLLEINGESNLINKEKPNSSDMDIYNSSESEELKQNVTEEIENPEVFENKDDDPVDNLEERQKF